MRFCKGALALTAGLLALLLSILVVDGFYQGFEYAGAMRALLYAAPVCAAMLILLIVVLCLRARYETPTSGKVERAQPYRDKEMPDRRKNILRAALITLAALLILLGITNGGLWDVLVKAINICTECIGLG